VRRKIPVIVLLPTDIERSRDFADALGVSYPIYADPTWNAFDHYTRRLGALPLQAWAIVDAAGVLRWIWQLDGGPKGDTRIPLPSYIVDQLDEFFLGAAA
jgi:hypothetical protein